MTDEDKFGYDLDPKLDMEYASRKIPMPEDSVPMEHFRVQPHHLDTNHHVNNSQYITMAMEYLPGRPEIREIRVYYRKQAFLGDEICPRVSMEKDKIFVLLANTEDEPYAIVELFPCTGRDSKR